MFIAGERLNEFPDHGNSEMRRAALRALDKETSIR